MASFAQTCTCLQTYSAVVNLDAQSLMGIPKLLLIEEQSIACSLLRGLISCPVVLIRVMWVAKKGWQTGACALMSCYKIL